jgi:8-oxo-dGTP diphosphatase
MIEYVVGFLFNESLDQIALIRKEKPDWQRGKINGIGGKIEENESPEQAMRREFKKKLD